MHWNEIWMEWDRMKPVDCINENLCWKNEAGAYINNVKYYQGFGKRIKILPPELLLSGFHHPS